MSRLDRGQIQLLAVCVIGGLWAVAVVVAAFDGTVMLKALTPMMTMLMGWLFAARVTQ